MESMDYNYFTSTATQPYQYLGFGADAGFAGSVSNDGSGPVAVSGRANKKPQPIRGR